MILDINALEWKSLQETITLKETVTSIIVMLNSHLALSSSNEIALYIANSYNIGAKMIYPKIGGDSIKENNKRRKNFASSGINRQFKSVDLSIVGEILDIVERQPDSVKSVFGKTNKGDIDTSKQINGTLVGALSSTLSYINKIQNRDDGTMLKSRTLIISVSDDNSVPYISMMNCIFAAQKMKTSIDVCKLGKDSTFLQQASDATNGVYVYIKHPKGLIQYLSTALFIDPMLRPIIVLPTNSNIDFRASCFITNKVVDIGYVCSVCLCILSIIPIDEKCPTCHSKFDHNITTKLRRRPKVLPLVKRKTKRNGDGLNGISSPSTPVN